MSYNGELHHHGVKGMKWGVRKARKKEIKADTKTYDSLYRSTINAVKKMNRTRNKKKKVQYQDEAWNNSNKLLDFQDSLVRSKGEEYTNQVFKEWNKSTKRKNVAMTVGTLTAMGTVNVGAVLVSKLLNK